jgi:hypothetical protein
VKKDFHLEIKSKGKKVKVVQQGEENPAARNRKSDFWGADLRYQWIDLTNLRNQ